MYRLGVRALARRQYRSYTIVIERVGQALRSWLIGEQLDLGGAPPTEAAAAELDLKPALASVKVTAIAIDAQPFVFLPSAIAESARDWWPEAVARLNDLGQLPLLFAPIERTTATTGGSTSKGCHSESRSR